MGIDSLRNHSKFTPRYIFACMPNVPMGIDSLQNHNESLPVVVNLYPWVHTRECIIRCYLG